MSRYKNRNQELAATALANFGFTLAKVLMVLLLISLAMLSVNKSTSDGIKLNAEHTIEVHWPDNSKHDVDTWLQLPDGRVVWYTAKEVGLATLERDDVGTNNTITMDGRSIESASRIEIISLRGIVPGEYVLNLMLYRYSDPQSTDLNPKRTASPADKYNNQPNTNPVIDNTGIKVGADLPEPIPVTIEIKKMNPKVLVAYAGKTIFTKYRQELHILRFTISPDGSVINMSNELPTSVVAKHYSPGSFYPPEGAF